MALRPTALGNSTNFHFPTSIAPPSPDGSKQYLDFPGNNIYLRGCYYAVYSLPLRLFTYPCQKYNAEEIQCSAKRARMELIYLLREQQCHKK